MAESQLSELRNMRLLLEEARILARNLAYHRRARLEEGLGRVLDEVDRPNGSLVAAFGEAVTLERILHVAKADELYMRAVMRQERFSSEADSETAPLFAADVKEARSEFLLALEAVFRG
jgi:hypothetical protein